MSKITYLLRLLLLSNIIVISNTSLSLAKSNDYLDYYNKGIKYFEQNDFENALKYFNKYLELNPNFAKTYSKLGNIYFKTNNLEKVLQLYKKALSLDPKFSDAYNNIGTYYTKKRLQKCFRIF